jgi:glycosyltransferase involved in cell wall biosynthesis
MPPRPSCRLAVVLSHPTQYYSPWFRWIQAHTPLQLRVFYLWDFGIAAQRDPKFQTTFRWDVDLLSGYESEFVPNVARDRGTHHFRGLNNPDLPARLDQWNPAAVLVFGYKSVTHLRLLAWAWRRSVPLLFRGDSHLLGRGAMPLATRLLLRSVFLRFAAFLPVGAANRAYFAALGVPERKLFFAPHAVNAEHFDPRQEAARTEAAALRRELGLGSHTRVVLFAGKLVPEKQPAELLAAFQRAARPNSALVFVGEGPEKDRLRSAARASSGANPVHFLPFANQSEMPSRYLLADVFVLPSRGCYETWGLAVNEAMHMGVPALVSDRVGCQQDLVTDGVTGWVFPAENAAAFVDKLGAALDQPPSGLRDAVKARVAGYSYAAAADGLLRALAAIKVGKTVAGAV